jgi:hypothetical protein
MRAPPASARYVARRAGVCGECAACRCWCALLGAGEPLRVRARLPHRCRGFPPSLELRRYTTPAFTSTVASPTHMPDPLRTAQWLQFWLQFWFPVQDAPRPV